MIGDGKTNEIAMYELGTSQVQAGGGLLDQIAREKLLTARGVYGFFPANSSGDNVELRGDTPVTFHFLRQQMEKPDGQPNLCLADFIAPAGVGQDYIGAFAVTAGLGADKLTKQFKACNDNYNAILAEALADRLAEAFAEYLHRRVRAEWGYGKNETLTIEQLIEEQYRGIRPAAGYPACPDHTEKCDPVATARCRKKHRHQADRKRRHVARQQRQRPLLCPSPEQILRRGQAGPRPDPRLPSPQSHGTCAPWKNGSAPI